MILHYRLMAMAMPHRRAVTVPLTRRVITGACRARQRIQNFEFVGKLVAPMGVPRFKNV